MALLHHDHPAPARTGTGKHPFRGEGRFLMQPNRLGLIAALIAATLSPAFPATSGRQSPSSPKTKESPAKPLHLFFTDEIIARTRKRIAGEQWAARIWRSRLDWAHEWMSLGLGIPKTGGGYYHDYFCPYDGAKLRFDPHHPHEHLCPACKRRIKGPKYDAYWVAVVHGRNFEAARILALAAVLDRNPDEARWPREILLAYARRYADYPVHGNAAGRGKIFFQSLDESVGLLTAAETYELLLAGGFLSPEQAAQIREKLFRPAAALVRRFRLGVHNIQCWHSAFLFSAAIICGDTHLRDEAVADIEKNLKEGVTPEGWWFEGSPGYHFYTLQALSKFVIPAKHNDIAPPDLARMRDMLLAPFRVAFPNLQLPTLNDSGPVSLGGEAPLLEVGAYVFGDRPIAAALAALYERSAAKRTSLQALFYGPDRLPAASAFKPPSTRLDHAGMAILRRPQTDLYALLRYGRFQGWHDHPDRLELVLYGLGQPLAPDLGTCGYRAPLIHWYKSTVAHNTLVIDEKSQDRRASDAECLFFRDGGDFSAAAVRATRLYRGVEMTRTVVVLDSVLIDYCRVRAEKPHTTDWVYRNTGRLAIPAPAAKTPPAAGTPAYRYLENIKRFEPGENAYVEWTVREGKVRLKLFDMKGAELFSARCPGFPGEEKMSLVLVRRRGRSADFISAILLARKGGKTPPVHLVEHGNDRAVVRVGEGTGAKVFELRPNSARLLPAPR